MQSRETGTLYLTSTWSLPTMVRILREVRRSRERVLNVAVSFAAIESSDVLAFMRSYVARVFHGCELHRVCVAGETAAEDVTEFERRLQAADLVFLAPGDVVRAAALLRESGAMASLRQAHARGVPFIGMSAGAILLGSWWAEWGNDGRAELIPMLDLLPGHIVDCHDEAEGWPELRTVHALAAARGLETTPIALPSGAAVAATPQAARWIGPVCPASLRHAA